MPIEEKKKPLEFEFIDTSANGASYEVTYQSDGRLQPIMVENGGVVMHFSTKFFEEVVDYLKKKGILKNTGINVRGGKIPDFPDVRGISEKTNSLPIPQIEGSVEIANDFVTLDDDPLASFDISIESPPITKVSKKVSAEEIKRPVIRTRVIGDDPMSAEKEASQIRGLGKSGEKKVIKRKENK